MNELGKKIFVSYKYKDNDVKMMPNVTQPTWPCDYVDYIKNKVLCDDDIYKGEKYSLQGTTQGRYLTGGVPPVRFSM